ncbi:MAG TPA: cytochrome d ubiquinol oxidase subunit II [Bacteroidetes bacterium]|nr:cytochrome d ubiquinol oxidase subunit II [Bacteroidota bacterium]
MFEKLSLLGLQQYWWIIISLLGAILVALTFVQGGQTLVWQLAKNEKEKSILINAIGRRWDTTFTTLVTFGGAFFASFPLFYSTSFGGAYWVWMIILFSFVVQAVSYEFRTKANNLLGTKTYDTFLFINGVLGTVLLGAAVGTFFTGSHFIIEKSNITFGTVISQWTKSTHGLEAIWSVYEGYPNFIVNLFLGISVLFLARVLGNMYFLFAIDHEILKQRIIKCLKVNSVIFLFFFLFFLGLILTKKGFAVNPQTKEVYLEKFKYLHNLLQMPVVLIMFLAGVVGVLFAIYKAAFKGHSKAFWFGGVGTVLVVLSLFLISAFNNTAYYPSIVDLQSSLTIENSSSSRFTLVTMSYVSLAVPFVIAYAWYAWRQLTRKKIDENDIENDNMSY